MDGDLVNNERNKKSRDGEKKPPNEVQPVDKKAKDEINPKLQTTNKNEDVYKAPESESITTTGEMQRSSILCLLHLEFGTLVVITMALTGSLISASISMNSP